MKRVLFLSRSLGAGGAERRMVTVARLLKERGYGVELVCYDNGNFFGGALEQSGITVYWLENGGFFSKLRQIKKIIKGGKSDVSISFLPTLNIINCLASFGTKNIVILGESSSSSAFEHFMGWKYVLRGYVEDYLAWMFADVIVSNSDNASQLRIERSWWIRKKMWTIHNPVLVKEPDTEYVCRKDGKLHVVVAASIQAIKNPLAVIRGIAEMDYEVRNKLRFDWYGNIIEHDLYEKFIGEIEKYGLNDIVTYHQPTNEIGSIMYQADVVALFSVAEGLPNAICEGMMLGKPIIMTRISDYVKMVDETNGFLCESDDVKSIGRAFEAAISSSDESLLLMGRKSREKARMLYQPEKIGDEWKILIDSL
jgi:glycosyltransferase involved in cell wall biosynthesis